MPHWLLLQNAAPLAGTGQTLLQPPQLNGSPLVSVQVPLQQVCPLAQQVWAPLELVQHWPLGQQVPPQAV
jgi:hypothetical protein